MLTGIKGRSYNTEMGISELKTIPKEFKRINIEKSGDKPMQPNMHILKERGEKGI